VIIASPPEHGKRWLPLVPKVRDVPLGIRIGVLGRKGSLLILRQLAAEGRPGFHRLRDVHPRLSRQQRSTRLNELQREGYLQKLSTHSNPKQTAYRLTDKGRDALSLLYAFSEFVRRYSDGVPVSPGRTVHTRNLGLAPPEIRAVPGKDLFDSEHVDHEIASVPPRVVTYRTECENCKRHLSTDSEAYVCTYGCTWCQTCAENFEWRCPNCQGKLRPRTGRSGAGAWPH